MASYFYIYLANVFNHQPLKLQHFHKNQAQNHAVPFPVHVKDYGMVNGWLLTEENINWDVYCVSTDTKLWAGE